MGSKQEVVLEKQKELEMFKVSVLDDFSDFRQEIWRQGIGKDPLQILEIDVLTYVYVTKRITVLQLSTQWVDQISFIVDVQKKL